MHLLIPNGRRVTGVISLVLILAVSQIAIPAQAGSTSASESSELPSGGTASDQSGVSSDTGAIAQAAESYQSGDAISAIDLAEAASATEAVPLTKTSSGLKGEAESGTEIEVAKDGTATLTTPGGSQIGISVDGQSDASRVVDGALVQTGVTTSTDVVTRATADGVQLVGILADDSASDSVAFPIDLPTGAHLSAQSDGSIAVLAKEEVQAPKAGEIDRFVSEIKSIIGDRADSSDELTDEQRTALQKIQPIETTTSIEEVRIATIASPWAVDANGRQVDTAFEIVGNTVRQVTFPDAETAYPVAVDPKISTYWWGWQIKLSNKETNKLVKAVTVAAGAAGLAAALQAAGIITAGSAAATGVAAGLLALGAGVIDLCNWNDKGIYINITRIGGALCWAR